jgi:hypothetical protein
MRTGTRFMADKSIRASRTPRRRTAVALAVVFTYLLYQPQIPGWVPHISILRCGRGPRPVGWLGQESDPPPPISIAKTKVTSGNRIIDTYVFSMSASAISHQLNNHTHPSAVRFARYLAALATGIAPKAKRASFPPTAPNSLLFTFDLPIAGLNDRSIQSRANLRECRRWPSPTQLV